MRSANLASVLEVLVALEGTGTGAWGWDVVPNTIRWSLNTGLLYGRERGYEPTSYEEFLDLVHRDDRHIVETAVTSVLEGGGDYEIDFRVTWPDGSLHWLNARGHAIPDDEGKTARIVGVVADFTDRKREAELHRFLATAGAMLAASLDVENTLARIADLLVAELADWCSVQMLEDGKLRIAVVAHRRPEMRDLVQRLQDDYPPDPEPTGPARVVLETGAPLVIDEINDEMLAEAAIDEQHLHILRSLGLCSALIVPIRARDEIVALMTLISAESLHRFGESDTAFAEELAQRAGLALDNARLHQRAIDAQQRAELYSAQLQAIHNVVAKLSQAADMEAVARAAVEEGAVALGAARGSVVMRTEGGPRVVASVGYPPERLDAFRSALSAPGPLFDAMTSGATVFCGSVEELIEHYPNLGEVMRDVPAGAFIATPLSGVDGVVGAIGFVYGTSRVFTMEDQTLTAALAQHVSLAVERGMLFERNRSVAEGLQAALAPPPVVGRDGVPAAARYRAAGVGAIGGDWYDVVDSPAGTQVYVIGDVVGRGLEAVATMAQLRHSLRMLLMEGHAPADALSTLSMVAGRDTTALCSTVLCAEVRPGSEQVRIASAGHLPPVVVRPGSVQLIDLPVGPPLGVGPGPPSHTIDLGRDECLVLYTDGVVERRDRPIDVSLHSLTVALSGVPPVVEDVADALLAHAEEADDDATILVVGGSHDGGAADGKGR